MKHSHDETKIDLQEHFEFFYSQTLCPLTIVDAYFICKYGKQYEQEQN